MIKTIWRDFSDDHYKNGGDIFEKYLSEIETDGWKIISVFPSSTTYTNMTAKVCIILSKSDSGKD